MRIVVVLPAPLGPSNPTTSPRPIAKLTPSTAATPAYRFVSRSTRIIAAPPGLGSPAATSPVSTPSPPRKFPVPE